MILCVPIQPVVGPRDQNSFEGLDCKMVKTLICHQDSYNRVKATFSERLMKSMLDTGTCAFAVACIGCGTDLFVL